MFMGELRLYAISIDEVRDMFGADDDRAEHLRQIAAEVLPRITPPAQRGLLGKLGPLFRRVPGEELIPADQPQAADLSDQLAGRHSAPERLPARWQLLEALIAGTAWSTLAEPMPGTLLEDIDFSLACVDVPSSLGLAALLDDDLRVLLPALPGVTAGFCHYPRALARAEAYQSAVPQISEPDRAAALGRIAAWLDGFPRWAELAPGLGRPVPALVGFYARTT